MFKALKLEINFLLKYYHDLFIVYFYFLKNFNTKMFHLSKNLNKFRRLKKESGFLKIDYWIW